LTHLTAARARAWVNLLGAAAFARERTSADSVSLEKILDLEQLEVWTHRGFSWRPESIRVFGGQVAGQAWYTVSRQQFLVEMRFPDPAARVAAARGEKGPPHQRLWIRSGQRLPDDPLLHACAVTYVPDLFLLSTALPPHGLIIGDPSIALASLDHAVWFHAPFRADDWLLYEQESSWAGSGRALCSGQLFDTAGVLAASVRPPG
jgi:acyl-CoA thioesterase-2